MATSYISFQAVDSPQTSSCPTTHCTGVRYDLQEETELAAYGQPMTNIFLIDRIKKYIKNRAEELDNSAELLDTMETLFKSLIDEKIKVKIKKVIDQLRIMVNSIFDEPLAINFGKESLLFLLSQKEAEGIRFYFCFSPKNKRSVACVGVRAQRNSKGEYLIENGSEVPQDIGIPDNYTSVLGAGARLNKFVLNDEVGPPNTLGDLIGKLLKIPGPNPESSFITELSHALAGEEILETRNKEFLKKLLVEYKKSLETI